MIEKFKGDNEPFNELFNQIQESAFLTLDSFQLNL